MDVFISLLEFMISMVVILVGGFIVFIITGFIIMTLWRLIRPYVKPLLDKYYEWYLDLDED